MIKRIFFGQHYSFIFHPMYMYVCYRLMTLSDTCTIRRSWTLHAVPGLPVVAWGERGNILLARRFRAAHYDRDSCKKSVWKNIGNILRWTWILQRFNKERNPFLVCGKTWLIITFCCMYCILKFDMKIFVNVARLEVGQLFTQGTRWGHPCTLDTFLVDHYYCIKIFCCSKTSEKMLRKSSFSCTYNGAERHVTGKRYENAASRANKKIQ